MSNLDDETECTISKLAHDTKLEGWLTLNGRASLQRDTEKLQDCKKETS